MNFPSLLSIISLLALSTTAIAKSQDASTQNANHIFNAIHSSMRQWGSSLNHNGMSFFMATVPAGTQLYHGTSTEEPVKGMEWLAFEPEHAMIFARPRGPPGGRRPPPEHGDGGPPKEKEILDNGVARGDTHEEEWEDWDDYPMPPTGPGGLHMPPMHNGPHHPPPKHMGPPKPPPGHPHARPDDDGPCPPLPAAQHPHGPPPPPPGHPHMPPPLHHGGPFHPPPPHSRRPHHRQQPFHTSEPADNRTGYLHTYIPTHPLNLLYIDGLSAGKTSNGTLDTQDMLLLLNKTVPPDSPMGGEFARARGLCELSASLWQGKVDGVLRMEGGFEIVLCDFAAHLQTVSIVPVGVLDNRKGGWSGSKAMGGWSYIKAVTGRYGGIGGDRVWIDYEGGFVSVFEYGGMDLWKNDVVSDTLHPRLINAGLAQLEKTRDAVTNMVLRSADERRGRGRNWQEVADMVVKRYSAPLHYLHTNAEVRGSKEYFAFYLATLLRPFVSATARNTTLETIRCVSQLIPPLLLPPSAPPSLAHLTLHTVTSEICTTLLTALDITTLSLSRSLAATSPPPSHALDLVDSLVGYLQWTTWKECGPCADEEVCFVPIWPMGSLEEHRAPKCVGEDGIQTGYWGRFGPPPGGRRPGNGDRPGGGLPGEGKSPSERPQDWGRGRGRGPAKEGGYRWHRPGGGLDHGHGYSEEHRGGCARHGGHSRKGFWGRVTHAVGWVEGWLMSHPLPWHASWSW